MKARARSAGPKARSRVRARRPSQAGGAARRPKRQKAPALTEARILEVALTQVQLHGTDALSMRALAKKLGISVMGLYHHVPSKELLLDRLWGMVLARVPPLPEGDEWDVQLRARAVAAVQLFSRYPGLLKHGLSRPLPPIAMSFGKHTTQALSAAGFEPETAALATVTFHLYLLGTTVATELFNELIAARKAGREVDLEGIDAPRVDLATLVEFGADTFVAGLRTRLRA